MPSVLMQHRIDTMVSLKKSGQHQTCFYTESMLYSIVNKICVVLCLGVIACSGRLSVQVDGVDVYENEWNDAKQEIGARLRFEHDCDGPYEYVLIRRAYRYPSEVGVVACGQKWIFSRKVDGTKTSPWQGRLTSAVRAVSPFDRHDNPEARPLDGPDGVGAADTVTAQTAASSEADTSADTHQSNTEKSDAVDEANTGNPENTDTNGAGQDNSGAANANDNQ
ncbi:MAG: hypothetical protein JXX14_08315 [Deltaproteobacteria bacterium]|nr:hypothetical protein [Deltaproteobacteria bacterium]